MEIVVLGFMYPLLPLPPVQRGLSKLVGVIRTHVIENVKGILIFTTILSKAFLFLSIPFPKQILFLILEISISRTSPI